jgi:lipopolysaccharide/colanic/teichoic acid biosynthesis glycosyltransferase
MATSNFLEQGTYSTDFAADATASQPLHAESPQDYSPRHGFFRIFCARVLAAMRVRKMSMPLTSDILYAAGCGLSEDHRHLGALPDPQLRQQAVSASHPEASVHRDVNAWALSRTRRSLDLLCALIAFLFLGPVMVCVAVAVRLGSRGPVLFKQERMGRHRQVFQIYKFRSMTAASDPGSPITVTGDNRITKVGTFLRKYKLDELPQFWNILKGDMSLIGPRPKLPHHEALDMPFRPGITGAATLAFRFEEEMLKDVPREALDLFYEQKVKPLKAELDLDYMRTATLGTDLGILWKTAKACLSKESEELVVLNWEAEPEEVEV